MGLFGFLGLRLFPAEDHRDIDMADLAEGDWEGLRKEEGARRGPHSRPLGTARPWCRVLRMAWMPHVVQVGALSGQSTFGTLSGQSTFEHFRGMFGQSDDESVTRGRLGPWPTKYARGHWHAVHRGTCTRRILELSRMRC